ncbi:MAG TPA: PH domain-containing protein, partial [Usitatibacter sp.]|nr:PH domain-containing protein [Usitatibacter sp.]
APRMKLATVLAIAVCGAIMATSWRALPHDPPVVGAALRLLMVLPPVAVAVALLFVIRGYDLHPDRLEVRRLLWATPMPLAGLERAWHDPGAMERSMRLFGNSGLFSISGLFRNRALGNYRAFVTDPRRAVVLRTASRVLVVSPAEPRAFVDALASRHPGMAQGKP